VVFNTDVTYRTLSQYLIEIKEVIQDIFDYEWIVAEIANMSIDKNGHCWIELLEKRGNEIIAQCKGVIWKSNSEIIKYFFLKTGTQLQKGIKILFLGKAVFHEKYGFVIYVSQIDPSFTLGEMAIKKKEVIERLTREGFINKNKLLEVPLVIQRIAIISSKTAAGYEDFMKILNENKYGFRFHTVLFDTLVQGENAASSIIEELQRCAEEYWNFDVAVLVRGGGSEVDLHCFNDYELAKKIALMPIPVFTGIGHTRDETVVDYVSSKSFKTPSELAKFIIDRAFDFYSQIENLSKRIYSRVEVMLKLEAERVKTSKERIHVLVLNCIERSINKVNMTTNLIHRSVLKRIHTQREKLSTLKYDLKRKLNLRTKNEENLINSLRSELNYRTSDFLIRNNFNLKSRTEILVEKAKNLLKLESLKIEGVVERIHLLNPENILKRGYSITYAKGKVVKDVKDIDLNEEIFIKLYKGKIKGKVIDKEEDSGEIKLL